MVFPDRHFGPPNVPAGALFAACGGGNWLTLDYYNGTVNGFGDVDNIPTHLDASNTSAGEVYTANIVFTSNPNVGTITVPVTMIIMGSPLYSSGKPRSRADGRCERRSDPYMGLERRCLPVLHDQA